MKKYEIETKQVHRVKAETRLDAIKQVIDSTPRNVGLVRLEVVWEEMQFPDKEGSE